MVRYVMVMLWGLSGCVLSGCSALSELTAARPALALKEVAFGDIDLQTATLLFDVEVDNPYSVPLPLLNLDYTLTSGDHPLFGGNADIRTTIPAHQKQIVTLPVTLSYTDVLNAFSTLKDVRPGSMIPYEATVAIVSEAPILGAIRIPIQKAGRLKVPALQDADSWKTLFNALERLRSI